MASLVPVIFCNKASMKARQSQERRSSLHSQLAAFADQRLQSPLDGPEEHAINARKEKLTLTLLLVDVYEREGLAGRELALSTPRRLL